MSIYIVTNKVYSNSNMYKIGKSSQTQVELIKRYKTALGNPHIVFHHLCSNCADVEKTLHSKLEQYRADGEWFELDYFTLMKLVIVILEEGDFHFSEVILTELDIILKKLRKKDLSTLGIKDAKKDVMISELKKNLSLLYRLESGIKMKITKTNSEKEALKIIDSLISKNEVVPEETFDEKALKVLQQGKSDFITLIKNNPDDLERLSTIAISNDKEEYIIDFAIEEGKVDLINKFVDSREAIIEECIKEGKVDILSSLLSDEELLSSCYLAIDYDQYDIIDMILKRKDIKTEIIMYAAQNNKKDIVERYANNSKDILDKTSEYLNMAKVVYSGWSEKNRKGFGTIPTRVVEEDKAINVINGNLVASKDTTYYLGTHNNAKLAIPKTKIESETLANKVFKGFNILFEMVENEKEYVIPRVSPKHKSQPMAPRKRVSPRRKPPSDSPRKLFAEKTGESVPLSAKGKEEFRQNILRKLRRR